MLLIDKFENEWLLSRNEHSYPKKAGIPDKSFLGKVSLHEQPNHISNGPCICNIDMIRRDAMDLNPERGL